MLALFFDAGNTLVFPNRSLTLAALHSRGVTPTQEQLWAAERVARRRRDEAAAAAGNRRLGDIDYWTIYYTQLFSELGAIGAELAADSALLAELIRASHSSANWDVVLSGTHDALIEMKKQFRLGVISNSDGHMSELIARLGLDDCFEHVIDSGVVRVEKPNPRIFEIAAEKFGVAASACVYIGDVYSIDYLGAKSAGFDAVLFDVCGAYKQDGLPRVESMRELQQWLDSRNEGNSTADSRG